MPIEYTLQSSHRLLVTRAWGVLTGDEIATHCHRHRAEERLDPPFRHLVDLRDVTDASAVPGDLPRKLTSAGGAVGVRRAFVAHAGAVFGLARQHATYAELSGAETEVFTSVREAEAWLGVSRGQSGLTD